jgi:DNA-binding YbaB/EbfC family protein
MFNKLKQFKDLRSQAKELQNTLSEESAEGSASFGKVKITMDGNQSVTKVSIDDELLDASKKDKLEIAVKDATNDAVKKVQSIMAKKMRESGLDLSAFGK